MRKVFTLLLLCSITATLKAQIAPPVIDPDQNYCKDDTVGQLRATVAAKDTLIWYQTSTGNTRLPFSTPLTSGKYYATAKGWVDTVRASTLSGRLLDFSNSPVYATKLDRPQKTAIDRFGNIYFLEEHKYYIRKISPAGMVTIFAGADYLEPSGAHVSGDVDGAGTAARFGVLDGITVDFHGTVYVSDQTYGKIKKITPEGIVTTYAGIGWAGYNDGPALEAQFSSPAGLAISFDGTLFVVDHNNHCIRKIEPNGGNVSTLAGGKNIYNYPGPGYKNGTGSEAFFQNPREITLDPEGNIYISDQPGGIIVRKITPSGVVSTYAGSVSWFADGLASNARFGSPHGLVTDTLDNTYIADYGNHAIRKITSDGTVSTVTGGQTGYTDGALSEARFTNPVAISRDTMENLYIADQNNHMIRKISKTGSVSTIAGLKAPWGDYGMSGFVNGNPQTAQFHSPHGIAVSKDGSTIIVADLYNHSIRQINITPTDTTVITLAGNGNAGFTDNTTGANAQFNHPTDVFVDNDKVYVVDANNHRIRQILITPTDTTVTTLAGIGDGHQDGGKTSAQFTGLSRITQDTEGNLFVSQLGNSSIRKITFVAPDSLFVSTISSYQNTSNPTGIGVDADGNLLVSEHYSNLIKKVSFGIDTTFTVFAGRGHTSYLDGPGVSAAFNQILGLAADSLGNLFVADDHNHKIRKIAPDQTVSTLAGSYQGYQDGIGLDAMFNHPRGLSIDSLGNLYMGEYSNYVIRKVSTTTAEVTTLVSSYSNYYDGPDSLALFYYPRNTAVDALGNVYVADEMNHRIRKITPDGTTTTLAGNGTGGGNGTDTVTVSNARFHYPKAVAVDLEGNILVADGYNRQIRKILFTNTGDTVVTVVAGYNHSGYLVDGPALDAHFGHPFGITVDSSGNIYVADSDFHVIRKITPAGVVSTFAGKRNHSHENYYFGQAGYLDGEANEAMFNYPSDIAIDKNGNLYVADHNNYRVRKITPDGTVSTIMGSGSTFSDGPSASARFHNPQEGVYDSKGNLFVTDRHNNRIRKIDTNGNVSTFAGNGEWAYSDGTGITAKFREPVGITIDENDNLYVVDHGNHMIRKITPSAVVTTFAGTNNYWGGFADSDPNGEGEQFNYPHSIAYTNNFLYVSDYNNHRIRKISVVDSITTTIAGNGNGASTGDNGLAINAEISHPTGIVVSSTGIIYFVDYGNHRIRKIQNDSIFHVTGDPNGWGYWGYGYEDGSINTALFNSIHQITMQGDTTILVADAGNHVIRKIDLINNEVSTLAGTPQHTGNVDGDKSVAVFHSPTGLTLDSLHNIVVFDRTNHRIRKITFTNIGDTLVSTLAGSNHGTFQNLQAPYVALDGRPTGITVDTSGNVYTTLYDTQKILKISPDSSYTILNLDYDPRWADGDRNEMRFNQPVGISVDPTGNLYIADYQNHKIRKVIQQILLETDRTEVDVTVFDYTLAIDTTINPSTCAGADGSILFATNLPSGTHTLNYTFNESPENQTVTVQDSILTFNNLVQGDYSDFSVIANGCTAILADTIVTLSDPPIPVFTITSSSHPTTCMGKEGNITFTVSDVADGPHTISFKANGIDTTATVSVLSEEFILDSLAQGNYSHFSILFKNCLGVDSTSLVTLSDPAPPIITAGVSTNPSACGNNDGSIAFTVSNVANGKHLLSFSFNNSPMTDSVEVTSGEFTLGGLYEGDYKNFNIVYRNCSDTDSSTVTLSDPNKPVISKTSSVNPSTCEGSEGSILFGITQTTNGSYTLSYKANEINASTTVTVTSGFFTLSSLPEGKYSHFSITNANNCVGLDTSSTVLTDPPLPVLELLNSESPTICDGQDGSINFAVSNTTDGVYTLNYKKNGTDSTKSVQVNNGEFTLGGLGKGTYTLFSFTNQNDCSTTDSSSVNLVDPPLPVLSINLASSPTTCNGVEGSIPFTITNTINGSYTLTFKKNNVDSSAAVSVTSGVFTLGSLSNGEYSDFAFTNQTQCTGTKDSTVILVDPPMPVLTLGTITQPSGCDRADGSVLFTISNTVDGSYMLSFNDSLSQLVTVASGEFTLSSLSAGDYTSFILVNENACAAINNEEVNLQDPPLPVLALLGSTDPSTCSGTDGKIDFSISNVQDGSYTINFTFNAVDSSASISVTNGLFALDDLEKGTYGDFSIDYNDCIAQKDSTVTLSDPPSPELSVNTVYNPTNCLGQDGAISFSVANVPNGVYYLSFKKNDVITGDSVVISANAFTLENLSSGEYTDFTLVHKNCSVTIESSYDLTDPETPEISSGIITQPTTCSGTNGSIAFTTENLPDMSFTLSYTKDGLPASSTVSVSTNAFVLGNLGKGTYKDFSLTYLGCTALDSTSKILVEPQAPVLTLGTVVHPTTCDGTEGSIGFTVTNVPDNTYTLSYLKNNVATTSSVTVTSGTFSLNGLGRGIYKDFSITHLACEGLLNTEVTLTDPSPAQITFATKTDVSTCNGTNGNISFSTLNLPNGNYTLGFVKNDTAKSVSITVTSNAFSLANLSKGVYKNFSVTHLACETTLTDVINIIEPLSPQLTVGTYTHPTTCTGTNGSIPFTVVNVANGTYTLSYTKNNAPLTVSITIAAGGFTLAGLTSGVYSDFSITNSSGCTGINVEDIDLNDPLTPSLTAGATTNPTLCDGLNGAIAFTTNLPNGTYTLDYKKNGANTTASIVVSGGAFSLSGLTKGTYTAFSISLNGCTGTNAASKTLTDPVIPTLTVGTRTNPTLCSNTNGSIAFTTSLPAGSYTLNYRKNDVNTTVSITVSGGSFTLSGLGIGTYDGFSITLGNNCVVSNPTSRNLSCPCATGGTITLASPGDDLSSGTHTKQASTTNGKIQATNKVISTAKVSYEAPSIELLPGFEARSGTVFRAVVGGCN